MSANLTPATPFTLGTLEQALVAGSGAGATAALAGEFGPISPIIKLGAVVVLAIDVVLGYQHITA